MQKCNTQGKEGIHKQLPVTGMAYAAAVLFAVHLVTYLIPGIRDATPNSSPIVADQLALLCVTEHLLLFPVVAALPAPRWARAAGYGWLVIDLSLVTLWRSHICCPLDRVGLLADKRRNAHCRLALSTRSRHILVHCFHLFYLCCALPLSGAASSLVGTGGTTSFTGGWSQAGAN